MVKKDTCIGFTPGKVSLFSLILLMVLFINPTADAQIKTSVKYSADIEYKINRAKQIEQQVKQYRKDSSKVAKQQFKQLKKSADSLVTVMKKQARTEGLETLNEKTSDLTARQHQAMAVVNQKYSQGQKYSKVSKREMRSMVTQNLENRPEFAHYQTTLDQQLAPYRASWEQYGKVKDGLDSLQTQGDKMDSVEIWQQLEDMAVSEAMKTNYYEAFMKDQGQLAQLGNNPQSMFQDNVPKFDFENHPLKKAKQAGMKHFEKINESIEESAGQIDKLKKKYASVPDSNDLKTAKKKNSLSGIPAGKRIVFGGNFHLDIGDPLSLDFNPILGYRLDKKWTVGIGGTVRFNLNHTDSTGTQYRVPTTGVRGFGEYRFFKSFLAHAEYEVLANNVFSSEQQNKFNRPTQSINIGLGNTFGIYKGLKGKVLLLYNIVLDGEPQYQSPWVVRFGFLN